MPLDNAVVNEYFDTVINSKGSYVPARVKEGIAHSLSKLDESTLKNPIFSETVGAIGRMYFSRGELDFCLNGEVIIKSAASFAENRTSEDVELLYRALKCSFDDSFSLHKAYEEQKAILKSLDSVYNAGATVSDKARIPGFADDFIEIINNIHNVAVKENKDVSKLHEYLSGFITYISIEDTYRNLISSPKLWTTVVRNTGGGSNELIAGFTELYDFFNLNMAKNNGILASPEFTDSFGAYKGLRTTIKKVMEGSNKMTGQLPEKYVVRSPYDCGLKDKAVILNGNVVYISQDARNNIALVPTKENLVLFTNKAYNDPILAGKLVSETGENHLLLAQLSSDVHINIVDRQLAILLDSISDKGFAPINLAFSARNDSGDVLSEKIIRNWSKNNTIKRRPNGSDEFALVSEDGVMFLGNQYLIWGAPEISAHQAPKYLSLNSGLK